MSTRTEPSESMYVAFLHPGHILHVASQAKLARPNPAFGESIRATLNERPSFKGTQTP